MYTLYMPKYLGDVNSSFLIQKVLSDYMSTTHYVNNVVSSPGYMGIKATTIIKFLNNLENSISKSNPIHIGFFNGMNGSNTLSSKTILDFHNDYLYPSNPASNLHKIHFKSKVAKDHRKMMFFFEVIHPWNFGKDIELANLDDFLNAITVNAILIGSSNQNLTSYYQGNRYGKAHQGEADIFMFSNVEFKVFLLENNNYNSTKIVLSESIKFNAKNANDYFKDILKDFLKNSLY